MKIFLAGKCNNNCLHCRVNKKRTTPFAHIKRKIGNFALSADDKRIVFDGAEPTVRDDIFYLLKLAKSAGAGVIQLNTNGRALADKKFARKIIGAGANYFKISLHADNPRFHDEITRTKNSFEQTIKGIRNLLEMGQKDNIVVSTVVTRLNYKNLFRVPALLKRLNIRKAQFNMVETDNKDLLIPLDVAADQISRIRYQFFFDVLIKTKGIPYCLIPEPESLILRRRSVDYDYKHLAFCKLCRYVNICPGVFKKYLSVGDVSKMKAVPDLPVEIMIEAEARCNFNCNFCFNRASFAKKGHGGKRLGTNYIKKIIDDAKKSGVKRIRFTGGEPMLREDLFDLIKYAKSRGLETRLNTNGSLIKNYAMAREMAKHLDYVLFGMHAYNPSGDEKITGFKGSFAKKVRAIKWLRKAGIKILRVNTIATPVNIRNLEKFYNLMKKLKIDRWAVNRLIPLSKKDKVWTKKDASAVIKKLVKIKKDKMSRRIPMKIHIVNAIPFCAGDPVRINAVSAGGRSVDGHERFAVDPRGFAKPIYYMRKNIGDPTDILSCWNHPFMKSLRSYKMVPSECKKCFIVDKCKGGNRFCAYMVNGSYKSADPLMDYSKVKNYIW